MRLWFATRLERAPRAPVTIREEEAQWGAVESEAGEQTDESIAVRKCDTVRQFNAASDFSEDVFVAPISERSLYLHISERIGCGTSFVTRAPADGKRSEPEREVDFPFGNGAARIPLHLHADWRRRQAG